MKTKGQKPSDNIQDLRHLAPGVVDYLLNPFKQIWNNPTRTWDPDGVYPDASPGVPKLHPYERYKSLPHALDQKSLIFNDSINKYLMDPQTLEEGGFALRHYLKNRK